MNEPEPVATYEITEAGKWHCVVDADSGDTITRGTSHAGAVRALAVVLLSEQRGEQIDLEITTP